VKTAVSVVVPTYNREESIGFCLQALVSQRTQYPYEIIVVDDGSTDGTEGVICRFRGVRMIQQKNRGPAAARNRGVMEATGDIVLFTDDDCRPEADWIEKMTEAFANPEVAGAKGTYLSCQRERIAQFEQTEYEEKYERLSKRGFIDFVDTYSGGFRRDVFLEAGGYDSVFPVASVEDQEFSFRVAERGYRMVFVEEAKVWHRHVDGLSDYVRRKFRIGYWKVLVLRRHPRKIVGIAIRLERLSCRFP